MKKRFWFAYYWVMITYLVMILINYYLYFSWTAVPDFFHWFDQYFQFDTFDLDFRFYARESHVHYDTDEPNNYYSFLLVLLMTVIRFIAIKKHIWELPDHNDLD